MAEITTLYHLTASSNAQHISVNGLLPYKDVSPSFRDRGLTNRNTIDREGWRKDVVWLTQDPKSVHHQMAGWSWDGDGSVVIEIDVSDLETAVRDVYFNDNDEPIEYIVNGSIPVERIKSMTVWSKWNSVHD